MKHIILTAFFILCWTQNSNAQRDGQKKKEIEAQKIAFITSKLLLSPEQSKVFWPIIEEHKSKEREIRRKQRGLIKGAEADDAVAKENMIAYLSLEEEKLVIQRKKTKDLSAVISYSQIAQLMILEREFLKSVISEMRNRKRN